MAQKPFGVYWREIRRGTLKWPEDALDWLEWILGPFIVLSLFYLAFGRERVVEKLTTTLLYVGGAILTALLLAGFKIIRAAYRIHLEDLNNIGRIERARNDLSLKLRDSEARPTNLPVVLLEFPSLVCWPDDPMKDKQRAPTLRTIEGIVLDVKIRSVSKGAWCQSFDGLLTVSTIAQEIGTMTTQHPREAKPSDELPMNGTTYMGNMRGLLEIVALKHDEIGYLPVDIPILISYGTAAGQRYGTRLTLQFYMDPRERVFRDSRPYGLMVHVRYDQTELIQVDSAVGTVWI